jgi:hypothetical protein
MEDQGFKIVKTNGRVIIIPVFNAAILKGRRVREKFPFERANAIPCADLRPYAHA